MSKPNPDSAYEFPTPAQVRDHIHTRLASDVRKLLAELQEGLYKAMPNEKDDYIVRTSVANHAVIESVKAVVEKHWCVTAKPDGYSDQREGTSERWITWTLRPLGSSSPMDR